MTARKTGYKESINNDNKYHIVDDNQPRYDYLISQYAKQAGILLDIILKTSNAPDYHTTYWANLRKKNSYTTEIGNLIILDYNDTGIYDHVNIVEKVDINTISDRHGNGNKIYHKTRYLAGKSI